MNEWLVAYGAYLAYCEALILLPKSNATLHRARTDPSATHAGPVAAAEPPSTRGTALYRSLVPPSATPEQHREQRSSAMPDQNRGRRQPESHARFGPMAGVVLQS
ncbi:hypothetical protein CCMA1212_001699 [Trichoderma ghanense]|uniref:Uncharacterized protein n=1 Tax=Trichoderma ghanense TaxID=65468 RepID=A0ABY2HC50_9HYPO